MSLQASLPTLLQRDWANWEPFKSTWSLLKTSCFKPYADTVQKQKRSMLFAIQQINRCKGDLSLLRLAEETCLCQRHFERKFKQHTGLTPKEYSRIMKFKHAVDLLRSTSFRQSAVRCHQSRILWCFPSLKRNQKDVRQRAKPASHFRSIGRRDFELCENIKVDFLQ